MKLTVNRTELLNELGFLRGSVGAGSKIPALGCVRFDIEGDAARLITTDLDMTAISSIHVNADCDGVFVVEHKTLISLLPKLDCEDVELEVGDGLNIRCGGFESNLPLFHADDYPTIPEMPEDSGYLLNMDTFNRMIGKVNFATTKYDPKFQLNGSLVKLSNEIEIAASDGTRLSVARCAGNDTEPPFERQLFPRRLMSELVRFSGDIEMSAGNNYLGFRAGERALISRSTEDRFPNYERLMDIAADATAEVERSKLLSALKRVTTLSHKKAHGVSFTVTSESLELESIGYDTGSAREEIPIACDCGKEFALNAVNLIEALKSIPDDNIKICLCGSQITISHEDDGIDCYYMQAYMMA